MSKTAIPGGGGVGKNSAWLFKTQEGYKATMRPLVQRDGKGRLTYVQGNRAVADLDEVSRKILEAGSGTSIFDPVLCEMAYRWFTPPGGLVLDPFAGGSVRGIIASMLGRRYVGIDLSATQLAA